MHSDPSLKPICQNRLMAGHDHTPLGSEWATTGREMAINQIESLLSIPSELSIDLLRLDPAWALLRDYPRFKRLLEGK